MSITPVFDQTVAASDADLWKASPIFPQPATHWSFAADRIGIPAKRIEGWGEPNWITTTLTVKVEPKWRTFLRCLLWWMP
jgi:hypothetical protein